MSNIFDQVLLLSTFMSIEVDKLKTLVFFYASSIVTFVTSRKPICFIRKNNIVGFFELLNLD
jgi:hypothetical protein